MLEKMSIINIQQMSVTIEAIVYLQKFDRNDLQSSLQLDPLFQAQVVNFLQLGSFLYSTIHYS